MEPADQQPGERRPTDRLARPPSERYAAPRRTDAAAGPNSARAALFGSIAAAFLSLLWFFFAGVLAVDYGALVVALIGGWIVGTAVAYGAWGERSHEPVPALRAGAVLLGLGGWLGGTLLDWVWSQATLPESTQSLADRLAQTPFSDWLSGQLSVLTALQVGLVALFSWRASR